MRRYSRSPRSDLNLPNSTPVSIRPALEADLEAIMALEQRTTNAAHWSRRHYESLLQDGIVSVAEATMPEGKPRLEGFLCARNTLGEIEIENIVVATGSQRRGIATALLQDLIRRVCAESALRVLLEVRESNLPARRLYEKSGFRQSGRRPAYYQNPAEDAVLYSLQLRAEMHAK
jgi:[ribosomal protein S18]-alanine N-acetyltransferase